MNTTIIAQRQISLKTGFSTGSGTPPTNRVILKPAPGTKATIARLEMLPSGKPRWGTMTASITVQAIILAVVLIIPLVFPQKMLPKMIFNVMPMATPVTEVPVAPEKPAVRPKPTPVPTPVEEAVVPEPVKQPKILAPKFEAPKVQPKVAAKLEAPKLDNFPAPNVDVKINTSEPARPRPPVETGLINTGSAAPATLNKPVDKVQTGGFGDPNGVAGPPDPSKRANVNPRGSGALPSGPGYGNGTGGANGARGTVASAGFGNGTAIPPSGKGGGGGHQVQQGSFSQAVVVAEAPKTQQNQAAAVQSIEILEKPRPEYTAEARALKLEGDVVLSVNFKANGQIQILGVIQGLGHGLDEMAVKAAQHIKYKPAISAGQPVDFPAKLRIEFQLAY